MISLILLIFLLSTFLGYTSSTKTNIESTTILGAFLTKDLKYKRIVGVILLLIGFYVAVKYFGITSGLFFGIMLLMTCISLLVVLYPLQIIKTQHILLGLIAISLIEFYYYAS
ncbi:hypothetical protein [Tenacibaculum amylolyticum]|uniref:hypothetical protein n=1 Tax=Tenacibaculum amylolyticum TaxID=104269 RepID=UPI003894575E